MEDEKNKIKLKAIHYLYIGAFVMFCLITTLVLQIMLVTEEVLQAEVDAESIWNRHPQLVSVRTVYSECRQGGEGNEEVYLTKDQCRLAAMEKAREEGLEAKASTAFDEYNERVEELKKNIGEPWPLSIVSRSIMSVASNFHN
jgi:hypothetical protein